MAITRCMIAAAAAALTSCAALGGGRTLSRGPDLPAAEGEIRFRRMDARATGVELQVRHLKEPERLSPPGYAYVAWVRGARESPVRNLGGLVLRHDRSGELRALTEPGCSEVFVTVEATSDAERPSGRRLLWADCE